MFVNKVILYDDYINIAYNISDNSDNNLKLENVENYFDIENKLNTKEEQSDLGLLFSGAGDRTWTCTLLGELEPESSASANFATPACFYYN